MRRTAGILTILLLGGLASCSTHEPGNGHAWDGKVRVDGSLREVVREGRIDARVGLAALLPDRDLHALGALAGLRGEVTIVAGRTWLAYPGDAGGARHDVVPESAEQAALLVSARVPEWRRTTIDEDVAFADLDAWVERTARAAGVDVARPFPYLVEGPVKDLRWHVIDGRRLAPGPSSHEDHLRAAVAEELAAGTALLVGFFGPDHAGIFTHHTTRTHVHAIVEERRASGHVDHVVVGAGARLALPVPRAPEGVPAGSAGSGRMPGKSRP